MGRWQPGARTRLEQSALELYCERGFEQTTVAEIAKRAGLTERTFFRHFADKREVLFGGAGALSDLLVSGVVGAPEAAAPIDAIATAFEAIGAMLQERRTSGMKRQAVIDKNVDLQERESIKLASLATAVAGALRERGVGEPSASLAAEAGTAVFKIAYTRWIHAADEATFPEVIRLLFSELRSIVRAS